ncbi:MAG TPA: polysaccharide ABC transporter ATP-binding protein [Cyclobacteriaceae bacterium]|nr:polysaccharide ABC transporter ATP-binding protein [Cyclobacteriaceae bacterium]HRJ83301.1 polysaccharide ABC transporter ATP-binding protein [Cyclobacteriaceae bacterium]
MRKVIDVNGLGKKYRLGQQDRKHETFAASLWHGLTAPIRNFKRIRNLSSLERESDSVFWALKDVSFNVEQGQVLGIIGHNGAGKSTLLKILSQITEPSEGEVILKGRVASLLEVGTGFHPELSGRDNVYMNGTILGMTKKEIDRKFDEIVDFSGVEKHIDTPVKFYSSGMKVRLGFAVAAHLEPEILIVDEVLAVGDLGFQRKCLSKMGEVAEDGRTILFVSHNIAAVQALCTHGLMLHNGQVVYQGLVSETTRHYLAEFESETGDFLSGIIPRQGLGKVRITSFEVENVNGESLVSTNSGADIFFAFQLTKDGNDAMDEVDIGFSIHSTEDDGLLTILYSSYMGRVFNLTDPITTIQCEIKSLPLPEGKYLVKAQVMQRGDVLDFPTKGVGYLEVIDGDFYGTGMKSTRLTRSKPDFLITGNWKQL